MKIKSRSETRTCVAKPQRSAVSAGLATNQRPAAASYLERCRQAATCSTVNREAVVKLRAAPDNAAGRRKSS